MKILSISGLDGSGKSTQIELLKNHLESQGKKVFYFHAIQFSIANRIRNQESGIRNQESDGNCTDTGQSVIKASWTKIQLRKIALVIDLARFALLRSKLRSTGYDYILSDRYFYDSVINIAYLAKTDSFFIIPIPCPDYAFYLDADPEKIMLRNRKPDQGIEYLKSKKGLLDAFAAKKRLAVIDGNRPKEEIFEEIKNHIASN